MQRRIVLKFGGSFLTEKSRLKTISKPALSKLAEVIVHLVNDGWGVILVHGAGSFGHIKARKYCISAGKIENWRNDDEKERENRIWQIEVAIQESLAFRQRYVELVESGIEPVVIEQAVRLILSQKESNEGDIVEQISGDICIHCDAQLDDEIDFCTGCGKYQ